MRTWRVTRVEAENFLVWEKLDWRIDDRAGITLILGDRGAGKSNGAGKSSLNEAILYGLYGTLGRHEGKRSDISKVRRRHIPSSTKTVVRLTIEIVEDGKTRNLVIERARGATSGTLRVSGMGDHALSEGAQEHINLSLGTYEAFTTTSMFTGEAATFCRLTDSARKEVLERMLGISRFTEAAERAKARLEAAERETARLRETIAVRTQNLERMRTTRASAAMTTMLAVHRALKVSKQMKVKNQELAEQVQAAFAKLREESKKYDAALAEAKAKRTELVIELEIADEALANVRKLLAESEGKVNDIRRRQRDLKEEIAQVQGGQHPDICPKCAQRWPHEQDPSAIQSVVAQKKEKILKLDILLAPAQTDYLAHQEVATNKEQEVRKMRKQLADMDSVVDLRALRVATATALELEAKLNRAQLDLVKFDATIPEEPDVTELDRLDDELDEAKISVSIAKRDLAALADTESRLKFWRKGFSRTGLPSFLVDSAIPSMNEVVAEVASALSDGELLVSFDPAAAKGNQSVFAVNVDYREGGEGFDEASKGEKTRVDVAVLFALRDLAARRGQTECSQLFLDEVMDGADEAFAQSFVSMLRSRYKDRQIYLISHDPGVASLVDKVITVKRRTGPAKLIGS